MSFFQFTTAVRHLSSRQMIGLITLPLLVMLFVALFAVGLYERSQVIMQKELRDFLRTTAAVGAQAFDADTLSHIDTRTALDSPQYAEIVRHLNAIRTHVPQIRYAYIMARGADEKHTIFLADADSLSTAKELDRNKNGVVDQSEQASFPGDEYDASDSPALWKDAFEQPTVDSEVTTDPWGDLVSGYAPIRTRNGKTIGVLGLDMEAGSFKRLSRSIFSLEALVLVMVSGCFLAVYSGMSLWKHRLQNIRRLEQERLGLMQLTSHQLGTPLTILKWSLESVKDGTPTPQQLKDHIRDTEEGISRIDRILSLLQQSERTHFSKSSDEPTVSHLSDVLAIVRTDMQPIIEKHSSQLAIDAGPDVTVCIDAKLLAGALTELIQNAIDFTSVGSVIHLTTTSDRRMVHISISDEGIGIPSSDLPYIAHRFRRGSNAALVKPDGMGLGLSIAKSIVEHAGGSFTIQSTEQKGTTVSLHLPIVL